MSKNTGKNLRAQGKSENTGKNLGTQGKIWEHREKSGNTGENLGTQGKCRKFHLYQTDPGIRLTGRSVSGMSSFNLILFVQPPDFMTPKMQWFLE